MPTIIDSLVVMLGIDAKDLEGKVPGVTDALKKIEKQGEKTEQSHQRITKAQKDNARATEDLSRVVKSFLAVIGGTMALKAFVSDFVNANAAIDRLSKNLGISVETISAWSNATQKMGGSAEGLQGTLDMLSRSQTQLMLTGQSSLIPYMSALGISLADLNGKARPVTDILLDLSDRFSRTDRVTANNMGRMMGLDQGTMNLLLQGRKELELEIERQKEQTAVTKAQAEEASKLQRSIVGVKQTFFALGRALLMDAAPSLEKLLALFQRFGNWVYENREFVADFLKVLAVGLAAIAVATTPIDLTVVAVLALAAAIALLWQDYQTWKDGGDSFIDWGRWVDDIKTVMKWIDAFVTKLEEASHKFDSWYQKVTGDKFSTQVKSAVEAMLYGAGQAIGVKGLDDKNLHSNNPVANKAWILSGQVSKETGISRDLIFGQWAHETGNFTNRGATQLNNLAGINVPGGKGQDYRKFNSLEEFADYYSFLMRSNGKYAGIANAKTPEDFAARLKAGGYFSDSANNYANGIRNAETRFSLAGVPGAAANAANAPQVGSGAPVTTVDKSVKVQTGDINIKTQATDAQGIAADMGRALDYLFTSQANTGLE